MLKRIALFALSLYLFQPVIGCGCGGGGDATDKALQGEWIAETPNENGETVLLVFDPTPENKTVKIQAIRPAGDTIDVDQGTYLSQGDHLQFTLAQLGGFDFPYTLEAEPVEKLTLGGDIYYKVNEDGVPLAGQIRIAQLSADDDVTVASIAPLHVPGEILVREKTTVQGLGLQSAGGGEWKRVPVDLSQVQGLQVQSGSFQERFSKFRSRRELRVQAELKALKAYQKKGMEAKFNSLVKIQARPNDPNIDQWGFMLTNMLSVLDDEDTLYGAGHTTYVAVLDTGVRYEHPELVDKILRKTNGSVWGYDFVGPTITDPDTGDQVDFDLDGAAQNGYDSDPLDPCDQHDLDIKNSQCSWHGTHLSGMIAAAANNSLGIAGVNARYAKIIPIRVIGRNGIGIVSPDVTQGIKYACKNPNDADCPLDSSGNRLPCDYTEDRNRTGDPERPLADVVNLSLAACDTYDNVVEMMDAIYECVNKGVLVVAAAGNDHLGPGVCFDDATQQYVENPDFLYLPASDPERSVISVGAMTGSGAVASYSNPNPQQFFCGPGGSLDQGYLSAVKSGVGDNGFWGLSGTSQGAAFVSGVASLIKSFTGFGIQDLVNVMASTAIYLGDTPPGDVDCGYGLINPRGGLLTGLGITPSGGPVLSTSVKSALDFGTFGEKATVVLYNAGGGTLALQNFSGETDDGGGWLKVEPRQINEPYAPYAVAVSVDRTDLPDGDYRGRVTIATNGGSKTIEISMKVDSLSISEADQVDDLIQKATKLIGGKGNYVNSHPIDKPDDELLVFALNVDDNKLYMTRTNFNANYNFYMRLPAGKYQIVAGIDGNSDGKICAEGDTVCIGYPTYQQLTTIDCSSGKCDPNFLPINY